MKEMGDLYEETAIYSLQPKHKTTSETDPTSSNFVLSRENKLSKCGAVDGAYHIIFIAVTVTHRG